MKDRALSNRSGLIALGAKGQTQGSIVLFRWALKSMHLDYFVAFGVLSMASP
jgi:hypothetical protein